jgi:hypothetical protein
LAPLAFLAASAARVRSEISRRSFSAQRGIEMQHEREFGHDEGDALAHQARDEGDIAGQPVELGHDHRTSGGSGGGKGRGQLWPAIERIGALAALGLDVFADQQQALGQGKALNRGALGFQPQPGPALPLGGDAVVGVRNPTNTAELGFRRATGPLNSARGHTRAGGLEYRPRRRFWPAVRPC